MLENSQEDRYMLLLFGPTYSGVVLPAVQSESSPAVSLADTPSRLASTWGRAQDGKPPCDLYVIPGISTPRLRWVEETKSTKRKRPCRSKTTKRVVQVAHTPSIAEDRGSRGG